MFIYPWILLHLYLHLQLHVDLDLCWYCTVLYCIVCAYVCMSCLCACVCVYACMHVCMYVCMYVGHSYCPYADVLVTSWLQNSAGQADYTTRKYKTYIYIHAYTVCLSIYMYILYTRVCLYIYIYIGCVYIYIYIPTIQYSTGTVHYISPTWSSFPFNCFPFREMRPGRSDGWSLKSWWSWSGLHSSSVRSAEPGT